MRIPIIKLPSGKLEPSLEAVRRGDGNRRDVIDYILRHVYPGFDEKRAFRALIAPALTRLHLARSDPPYFRFAPNGRIWSKIKESQRRSYLAVVLVEFMTLRLNVPEHMFPPRGSLKEEARPFNERLKDRVRGLDNLLREFVPGLPSSSSRGLTTLNYTDDVDLSDAASIHAAALACLRRSFRLDRIIAIDEARLSIMKGLLTEGYSVSSFMADRILADLVLLRMGIIRPMRGSYAGIESLIVQSNPYNSILLLGPDKDAP